MRRRYHVAIAGDVRGRLRRSPTMECTVKSSPSLVRASPGRLLPLLTLLACSGGGLDPTEPTETGTTPPPPQTSPTATLTADTVYDPGFQEGPFCAVRSIFEISCVTGCHSAVVPEAGLDLQTDPYTAIVNVPSKLYTGTLV